MSAENIRKGTPPYISPTTFRHLLEQLGTNPPDRIDRSYLNTMHSGGASTQIMSALRYLNLIDAYNKPTHHLKLLAASSGEERVKRLRDIASSSYSFIVNNSSLDPQSATYLQLEELFSEHCRVDGDVRRKCIKFFTSLAGDAGIPLSPHVLRRIRMARGSKTTKSPAKKIGSRANKTVEPVPVIAKVPEHTMLMDKLLDKFPTMDITWTDDMKQKWMDSFIQIVLKLFPSSGQ